MALFSQNITVAGIKSLGTMIGHAIAEGGIASDYATTFDKDWVFLLNADFMSYDIVHAKAEKLISSRTPSIRTELWKGSEQRIFYRGNHESVYKRIYLRK